MFRNFKKHQERDIWRQLPSRKKKMINIRLASKRNDFSFSPGFYFDGNAYIFAASVFNPYIHIYIYPFIHSTTIALSRVSSSLETFSAGACTRILYYTSFPRRHGGIKSASPFGGGRKKRKKKKKGMEEKGKREKEEGEKSYVWLLVAKLDGLCPVSRI